ncbi:hypothetical protein BH11GEM1_BH11GEM1_26510 [soil metagenome]
MARLAKFLLIGALLLFVAGATTMLLRGVVVEYAVTCTRAASARCTLARSGRLRASARETIVPLATIDSASVRHLSPRRGARRVLLYLDGRPTARFAAEFEGGDADDDAYLAARRLNAFFRQPDVKEVRVDAHAPRLIGILSWLALAVMALLVVVAVRAVVRPAAS